MVCMQSNMRRTNKRRCLVHVSMYVTRKGRLRSNWEEWWHTHTHTQRLTRLIGTCRTGMREECQLTWPPSRVRGQQPRLLCQQQRSGERQPAGLQASTPTEWLTVKLSQSPWIPQWCVTHFCLPERLQSGILSYIFSMRSWFKYLVCWLASWQMWHSLKFKRIILPKM